MDKIGYLKEVDIFAGLPAADIDEISGSLNMTGFPEGKIIYAPGDHGEVLFILKRGRVRIFRRAPDGRELTITELTAGTIFGEMALFGQAMHASFAQAIEDCVVCVIHHQSAIRMLENKPAIALRLAEVLGRRLLAAENRLESLGLKDVRRRLATLLLELADFSGGGPVIDRRYTHEELAKMIGTTRESITLALNEFKKHGWVRTKDHLLSLTDAAALKAYAGF